MLIEFDVDFVAGKARPRFYRGHVYTPQSTKAAERLIAAEYIKACRRIFSCVKKAPKNEPVEVSIIASRALPQSRPKRVTWEADTTKPDIDNICKLVLDGLNNLAWHDDSQIVALNAYKTVRKRDITPNTKIRISWGA